MTKTTHTLLAFFALATLLLCSCSRSAGDSQAETAEAMSKIDAAISEGNFKDVQKECNSFFKSNPQLDSVPLDQLCHLAIVMSDLADNSDECRDENAATAVLCYRAALERDSASTMRYLHSLDTEDYRHVYMLNQLLRPITDREDSVIYTPEEEYWNEADHL